VAVAAAFEGAFRQACGPGGGSDEWHLAFGRVRTRVFGPCAGRRLA